ncbi:MAG: DUF1800 domain-containing protein [Acidobacteriota bacterium]
MSLVRSTWLHLMLVVLGVLLVRPEARAADVELVRHLLDRTGFEVDPDQLASLSRLPYEKAVDRLLAGVRTEAMTSAPASMSTKPPGPAERRRRSEEEQRRFRRERREMGLELKAWWLGEMIATDSPLTERMTLFWHGHFTSSLRKVKWAPALHRQNELLRRHALGNFGELLHALLRDPAMIAYLDNRTNRVGRPNENFARELMELFTLGEGHYSEDDVKEAARAFTGWTIDPRRARFRFVPDRHDYGEKTVLGVTGRLDGDDVVRILLAQPQTARHVTLKLWNELVSTPPPSRTLERIADRFRGSGYETSVLLREILLSSEFRSDTERGRRVRSPVDLVVGTLRLLDAWPEEPSPQVQRQAVRVLRDLGQDLFDPPNVKGWPGGTSWVSTTTLLARRGFLETALERSPSSLSSARARLAALPSSELERLVLPVPPTQELVRRDRVAALLLDPAHQLE